MSHSSKKYYSPGGNKTAGILLLRQRSSCNYVTAAYIKYQHFFSEYVPGKLKLRFTRFTASNLEVSFFVHITEYPVSK